MVDAEAEHILGDGHRDRPHAFVDEGGERLSGLDLCRRIEHGHHGEILLRGNVDDGEGHSLCGHRRLATFAGGGLGSIILNEVAYCMEGVIAGAIVVVLISILADQLVGLAFRAVAPRGVKHLAVHSSSTPM